MPDPLVGAARPPDPPVGSAPPSDPLVGAASPLEMGSSSPDLVVAAGNHLCAPPTTGYAMLQHERERGGEVRESFQPRALEIERERVACAPRSGEEREAPRGWGGANTAVRGGEARVSCGSRLRAPHGVRSAKCG